MVQSTSDLCYISSEGETSVIGVYVDNFCNRCKESWNKRESENSTVSEVWCEGSWWASLLPRSTSCSGSQQGHSLTMSTNLVLRKYNMSEAKPVKTPVCLSSKLWREWSCWPKFAVGSLLYLSTRTRPDIPFAVGNVSRYCSKPNISHCVAVKRIWEELITLDWFDRLFWCRLGRRLQWLQIY